MKKAHNIRAITVLVDENEDRLAVTDYLVRTAGISAGSAAGGTNSEEQQQGVTVHSAGTSS